MSTVTLELSVQDARNMPFHLIGAYGMAGRTQHIAEKICSNLEWSSIENYLHANEIPHKFGNPTGSLLVEMYGADW